MSPCTNRIGHNKKAFLLFETMVAVIVLTVGMAALLRSFSYAITATKTLQDYTRALFFLEEKMSQVEIEGLDKTIGQGAFDKKFSWKIDLYSVEGTDLDKVDASIVWDTANSTRKIQAATYLKRRSHS